MLDQAERPCGVLAYGDLKRVELAMALANQPRLLLMDEPTAGMAPKERVALMELAAGLARAQKIAVLFTEHDMDVVFSQADRIIVLDRGQLIAGGPPRKCAPTRRAGGLSRERHDVLLDAPLQCTRSLSQRPRGRLRGACQYPAQRHRSRLEPARSWRCWAAMARANRPP